MFVVLFTKQIICTLIEWCEIIFDSCNILDHKFLSALDRIVVSRYWVGILRMFIFIIINSRYIIILIVYIGRISRRLFLLIEVLLKWCYFLNSRLILFGKHLSYCLIIASFFHWIRLLSDLAKKLTFENCLDSKWISQFFTGFTKMTIETKEFESLHCWPNDFVYSIKMLSYLRRTVFQLLLDFILLH
jgi:hypothetical protein